MECWFRLESHAMSKGKRYTEDQILSVLKEIYNGASIASVARAHGITDQTIYRWREKYAGMSGSELAELRALQAENQRLKRTPRSSGFGDRRLQGGGGGKMVSPAMRPWALARLLDRGISRRLGCKVVGLSR